MLNRAIEFHDAILESVSTIERRAILSFASIYIHESSGKPGIDSGSGWCQPAKLHIEEAVWQTPVAELPGELTSGTIRLGDETQRNVVALPIDYNGAIEVELELLEGASLRIAGSRVWLELLGEPYYVEEFPESSAWEEREVFEDGDQKCPFPVIRHYRPSDD